MTITKITAWVPIRILLRIDPSIPNDFYDCLTDFLGNLPSILKRFSEHIDEVQVKLARPPKFVEKDFVLLNQNAPTRLDFYEFIKLDCKLNYDKEFIKEQNQGKPLSDELIEGMFACGLSGQIEDAFLLAQLAYPARIKNETGRCWNGKNPQNTISPITGFGYALLIDQEPHWPKLETLSLSTINKWESKLGLFGQGIAKTPIQRALASFTHAAALSVIDEGEQLFWTMQGLEAFYCRGTGDLRRQLSEKSGLFLEQWKDKKNIVGHLYDFRSKFVHGSFNLHRWNNSIDTEDIKEREIFYTSVNLSTKMLIATLQKCAKENFVSVEFEYELKTN